MEKSVHSLNPTPDFEKYRFLFQLALKEQHNAIIALERYKTGGDS